MQKAKKLVLVISGIVLVIANIMIVLYGFNIVKFDFEIQPQIINFLGHGWFFWFFVLLTMVFNLTYIFTVFDEFKRLKKRY